MSCLPPTEVTLHSDIKEKERQGEAFVVPADIWLLLYEPYLPASECTPFTESLTAGGTAEYTTPALPHGYDHLPRNQLTKLSSAQRDKQNAVGHGTGVISLCC